MERSVEWFVALTSLVIGASHVLQPAAWIETYAILHRLGRPGAFVNGAMSLIPGAVIVAGHPVWAWPGAALTVFGWLLVAKDLKHGDIVASTEVSFRERPLVDRLVARLPPGARVLDVGCGCGEPVAAYLAGRGFAVTGLDGSARMLDLARRAVPGGAFVLGDMRAADPGGPFDALVAWDSVFHLPRADHPAVFARFHSWLRPGGRFLVSLGGTAEEGFTSGMHGETFFYSGHDPAEALSLLVATGFAVEHWEVDDPSSRGHVAVLAARNPA